VAKSARGSPTGPGLPNDLHPCRLGVSHVHCTTAALLHPCLTQQIGLGRSTARFSRSSATLRRRFCVKFCSDVTDRSAIGSRTATRPILVVRRRTHPHLAGILGIVSGLTGAVHRSNIALSRVAMLSWTTRGTLLRIAVINAMASGQRLAGRLPLSGSAFCPTTSKSLHRGVVPPCDVTDHCPMQCRLTGSRDTPMTCQSSPAILVNLRCNSNPVSRCSED
jgi:hypothetical protein